MKKKLLITVSLVLTLIVLGTWAVPTFAANGVGLPQATQITPANKTGVLARLLLVQDEAKVDAFIAKGVANGKLTADQAAKVKDFWTANHAKFAKNVVLTRLLKAQDESKVKAFLDKAVAAGKITSTQADKVIQTWESLHAPKTTT
jgi:polyhydroxyalkanoate synthesis regulator phasin